MNINYERVCRLCLSSRAETLPVFSSTSSDLDPPVLASKIEACVSVQICEGDALPTQVCKKCVDNVNNWHTFKEICEQAQVRLAAWLKLVQENKSGEETKENVEIKSEPEEGYGGLGIDVSYPEFEQINNAEKIQPEGPPILASLGLAPRQDKEVVRDEEEEELGEEEEEEDEDETDPAAATFPDLPALPGLPEVSVTVMRPTGAALSPRRAVQQLASKNCLVCGRAYRYSHNARRHELTSHKFDRYTNRVKDLPIKLRPNPFNPKARLVPNPINPKIQLSNKSKPSSDHSIPYPLRIKALSDLQMKMKEPEILKTLLTAQTDVLVSEPEVINSGSESPETLISEPEIASFQVEAIISEPDAFQPDPEIDEDEDETEPMEESHGHCNVDIEGDREMEIALKINGAVQPSDTNHEEIAENGDIVSEDEIEGEPHDEESTSSSLKMIINEEQIEANDSLGDNVNGVQIEGPGGAVDNVEDMEDEDLPPITLAPIVEINEELPANSFDSELGEEEEDVSGELNESIEPKEESQNDKICVTKTQRDFILKYRNIIEQINTKKCLCCDRIYPRRKAVIQHLQKSGHKIPKHTCYNCVVTFGHIGALLSHMRANICTNLWKLIYKEDGVTDDMIVDEAEIPESQYATSQGDTLNKGQYKDILNARSYACRLCPAKFQLKQFIMKHVLDVHEDGQSRMPLACVHCGYRFKENRLWKKHVRNGECTVNIACDLCPEKFMSMLEFNEHALAVHAGGFVDQDNSSKCVDGRPTDCPLCHKNTSSYHNLVKHLKSIHNEEKPHYCQHCDSKYEVISDLNQHIYLKHSDRSAASEIPDMSIVKEETEEYHYSCTECNGIFETVDAWTEHQISEHGQTAFLCDQCEKKFLQQSDLEKHKSTHLRVKLYPCPKCPNSYGSPQALSEHTVSAHDDSAPISADDPFFCTTCKRGFKSRQAYSNHMRIHSRVPTHNKRTPPTASAPGPSKTAPWAVAQVGGYLTFKNSYNNIPNAPYSCDICGKGFMHKKNIWKHKKVLHPEVFGNLDMSEENTMNTVASTEDEEFDQGENGTGLSIPQFDNFGSAGFANSSGGSMHPLVFHQCDLCVKKFTAKASLWKHKRVKHGIINPNPNENSTSPGESGRSSCTICKISFADKKSYYRHRKNVHKANIQMCKICGKPLNSTLELYEHLKAAHARELLGYNATQGSPKTHVPQKVKTESVSKLEQEDGPVDAGAADGYQARYPCESCGKYFLGMLALQNHQCVNRDPTPETFNCEICNKTYSSISALKSHRGWHLRSPDGKAAANNSGLWMPQHRVTNKSSKYEVNEELMLPMQPAPIERFIHSTPNNTLQMTKRKLPPEVEVTVVNTIKKPKPEPTPTPPSVMSGLLTGEDRYCKLCDKEFTKRAAFQRHMDEVHRPNSVFCPVCSKSFTRKSTLLVHMRKHYEGESGAVSLGELSRASSDGAASDGEAMYGCDLCGVSYRSAKSLRVHRVRHHGENEYAMEEEEEAAALAPAAAPGEFTCAQCGDGVATPRDLLAHRQMHATPTKFFCNICKVYFARAVDLSSHTRARHADNDKVFFPCAMCDRFYLNKKSLQRHIEMAH